MKKLTLLFAALLIAFAGFSQNIIQDFSTATDFFNSMDQGKFEEAHGLFDESVKTKITTDGLKQLWTALNTKLGKPKFITPVRSQEQGEYILVTVEGEFELDDQNFTLAFNKEGKMVGIFLPPKTNVQVYKSPVYADTTRYAEQEVYIETPNHQLAAIITTPKNVNSFPMVVLVHDSGPGDMDETTGPNKPFKDIAAGLAAKGIGSTRYVKRTLLYPQEFNKAFTVKEEVLDDVAAAIVKAKGVKGVNNSQLYVFGYGLGGMLTPRIATLAPELSGLILAASPARKMPDLLMEQNKYFFEQAKDTTQAMKQKFDESLTLLEGIKSLKTGSIKPDSVVAGLPASYWLDLNAYDQVAAAKKIKKQRFLVLQGAYDTQVSTIDYELWSKGLSGKKGTALKLYPDLNHLFIPQTEKGAADQYRNAGNVSETVINDIADWINQK
ncbi:DUF3887 domain-containing protein [Pedobacter sp. AW31-3R]|uniref:DUF3887 domain-containing protein n=1 Tax=Pedobacter sp. AW31-3R TaxID=3445781 RepID=UPI003FA09E02